jgi:hypothetical protein
MKITAYLAITVDGFIAREDGDVSWLDEPRMRRQSRSNRRFECSGGDYTPRSLPRMAVRMTRLLPQATCIFSMKSETLTFDFRDTP